MTRLMVIGLVFAGLAMPAVAARTVRVMSYNIRMGAGSGKWVACPEGDPWHLPEVAKASGYTVGDSKASDHLPRWIDLEIAPPQPRVL